MYTGWRESVKEVDFLNHLLGSSTSSSTYSSPAILATSLSSLHVGEAEVGEAAQPGPQLGHQAAEGGGGEGGQPAPLLQQPHHLLH